MLSSPSSLHALPHRPQTTLLLIWWGPVQSICFPCICLQCLTTAHLAHPPGWLLPEPFLLYHRASTKGKKEIFANLPCFPSCLNSPSTKVYVCRCLCFPSVPFSDYAQRFSSTKPRIILVELQETRQLCLCRENNFTEDFTRLGREAGTQRQWKRSWFLSGLPEWRAN